MSRLSQVSSFSQELARFVFEAKFEALPEAVVHEAKRILLDSTACAIAGATCERGGISIELSKRLGGAPESSIIGTPDKVSCCSAAFANGELINALDYDAFETPHGHFPPFVVSAPLAVAESVEASGADLVLATALGSEIACRIGRGLTPRAAVIDPKRGMHSLALGNSHFIFGGTAGAGKILKLEQEKMAHALGIAGHLCPVPTERKFQETLPSPMAKYGETGWVSMAAVTAALLAEMGYIGDTTVFDGEYGFWRMYSYGKWEPDKALDNIGETWHFLGIGYKPYPCHRAMHAPLDCFISIIDNNNLMPEEIESVRVFGHPPMMRATRSQEIASHIDTQSNVRYVFACAAHRIRVEDWQTQETLGNPEVLGFIEKVSSEALPDWREKVSKDPRSRWAGAVEVMAKGKTFREERTYPKGTAFTDVEMTDEQLADKFRNSASRILTQDKIDSVTKCLLELEAVENVRTLMEQVSL